MQRFLVNSLLGAACLMFLLMSTPASAQKGGPDNGASTCGNIAVWTSSPQVSRGYNIGVVALVTNCSSSKQRITVQFTSVSACGVETAIGYNRVALNPGQSIQVSVAYPIPENACPDIYTINAEASGGKSTLSTASTTFTVL